MDFVFLNSAFHSSRRDKIQTVAPHLRLGVASNAAYVRGAGAEVAVLDPTASEMSLDELVDRILELRPRYLCLPAYTEEICDSASVASRVKEKAPETTTILGGYHVSALPQRTLEEFDCFDFGIVGEGERALADVWGGADPATIPGAAYRANDGVTINPSRAEPLPLDGLPFPAWDLYDLPAYGAGLPIEPLRGCPFGCVFCFRALGRGVTYKSPERFVDEIENAMQRHGATFFRFLAGTFPLKRSHGVEICERILSRGLQITWEASTRVDVIDRDLLKLMKRSGCTTLQLGIESGDAEILRFCSKGITPGRCLEAARHCKEVGIGVGLNFILGLPHETLATLLSTFGLAWRLRPYAERANFAILVPFPGTQVYEMALREENGIALRTGDWSDFGKQAGFALRHANFPDGTLQRYQSLFYVLYYLGSPGKALRQASMKRVTHVLKRLVGGRKAVAQ
jgi:radical SAM superfamily enzyme YgiQ (UPF0313 family)